MACKIEWTELADTDLESIVRYIAEDNVDAARELGLEIITTIEETADFPFSGRKVPEKKQPSSKLIYWRFMGSVIWMIVLVA
jgi:plasmid stabilization system protein ParE